LGGEWGKGAGGAWHALSPSRAPAHTQAWPTPFTLQTLTNCGDAIRLEAQPPREADIGTVLDNTIWFESISNARVAVAVRAADGCGGDKCIIQGNQVLGSSVSGCASSGQSATVGFYYPTKPMPAWDSNQVCVGGGGGVCGRGGGAGGAGLQMLQLLERRKPSGRLLALPSRRSTLPPGRALLPTSRAEPSPCRSSTWPA
jgi:hypothetical protein